MCKEEQLHLEIKIAELKTARFLEVKYQEEAKKVEVDSPQPLDINLLLRYSSEWITITGNVEGKLILSCGRCLEKFLYPIKIKVNQRIPLGEISTSKILDLSEEIRQQIILNLPFKPLCKENCQGLCPECGENLNFRKCNCQNKILDPRLEKR